MSGTSFDGIDAGLVDFGDGKCDLIAFHYQPFDEALKKQLRNLSQPNATVLLADFGAMDARLGKMFGAAVNTLLTSAKVSPREVRAVGSHGLTLYHAPRGEFPFSLQIGDPNRIAETTGITTVADFRRRDIAAHGQGAPLVPAFHKHFFGQQGDNVCVVNIGGIANITVLRENSVLGFDTGPGNALLDYWIRKTQGKTHDANGEWARQGKTIRQLLDKLKNDPYFLLPPPKSTGKEYFSGDWLERQLAGLNQAATADVQATLCRLTADTICNDIERYAPDTEQTFVCGGGCHNDYLMELIGNRLQHPVSSTLKCGLDPDYVEAAAFAWLARQTMNNRPGNLYQATGASAPVILGGIYPGKEGLCGK